MLFRANTSKVSKLTRVQYVPQLAYNLLSVGQLMALGYSISFANGECKIKNEHADTLLACIRMTDHHLFPLDAGNVGSAHAALSTNQETKLWHRRFSHLNLRSLQLLSLKKLVKDLPNIRPISPCKG